MKKNLLLAVSLFLTVSLSAQTSTANNSFIAAWSAKHNTNNVFKRAVLDFSDSNLIVEWNNHKMIQPSTQNIHTISYDNTEHALKIAYTYIGDGTADNYDGAVTMGYGYTRKNDSTSQGSTNAFNPFLENDSIIGSYIDMSDVNNRSIRFTYKVKNLDLTDSASIRFDLFDVNGRETNDNSSSIKKRLQTGNQWQTITCYWGYNSSNDPGYITGWNQDALTFADGYSEKWWEISNGQNKTIATSGLPTPTSRPYTVPLDTNFILPQILFQINSGSKSDSWVRNMGMGKLDAQLDVYISSIEMGNFDATEAETYRFTSQITQLAKKTNNLTGTVYFDADKSGSYTTGDSYLQNQEVLLMPDSIFTFTDNHGLYHFTVDSGKVYSVTVIPFSPFLKGLGSLSTSTSKISADLQLGSIGLFGSDIVSFSSNLTSGVHRCGEDVPFYYSIANTGTIPADALVGISIDKRAHVIETIPFPDSTASDGHLYWKYSNLVISEHKQILLMVNIPSATLDNFLYTADVYNNDSVIASSNLNLQTLCSYDPNDITVTPIGVNAEKLTLKNNELQYTIRFQNTGNDYAYNVRVTDTLDSHLDVSTFKIIASSHNVRTEISSQGIVTFYFDNIMLPDSSVDYLGSNGFVSYSITPKLNVAENTRINNTAYIYFDKNPAIITNTTLNTLVSSLPCSQAITSITRFATPSVVVNGQSYMKSGIYVQPLLNACGCDSTLKLQVIATSIVGDLNGNGQIDGNEFAGDINGNGLIDGNEIVGDVNGDGSIDNNEVKGDVNGDGVLNSNDKMAVNEIQIDNLSIYPIPVKEYAIISVQKDQNFSVTIIDIVGQTIAIQTGIGSIKIDCSHFKNGLYFARIQSNDSTVVKSFVKE